MSVTVTKPDGSSVSQTGAATVVDPVTDPIGLPINWVGRPGVVYAMNGATPGGSVIDSVAPTPVPSRRSCSADSD